VARTHSIPSADRPTLSALVEDGNDGVLEEAVELAGGWEDAFVAELLVSNEAVAPNGEGLDTNLHLDMESGKMVDMWKSREEEEEEEDEEEECYCLNHGDDVVSIYIGVVLRCLVPELHKANRQAHTAGLLDAYSAVAAEMHVAPLARFDARGDAAYYCSRPSPVCIDHCLELRLLHSTVSLMLAVSAIFFPRLFLNFLD